MKKGIKSEKGAITMMVLVSMLFLMALLMSMYIRIANKAQTSAETTEIIKEKYNNLQDADNMYSSYFAKENVIPITIKEQLAQIGSGNQITVEGKIYTFSNNGYYIIKNDIDLGGYNAETGEWVEENVWTPITNTFTGTLDGLGHTISGMYINSASANNLGLFAVLTGTVKNTIIIDSYVIGNDYVGSIAGKNEGTIENCYNTGNIKGNTNVTGGYFADEETGNVIKIWNNNGILANAKFISGPETSTVPKGFTVSSKVDEQTIETGMVIKDKNENEFVWIPVTGELSNPYVISDTDCKEPMELYEIWNGNIQDFEGDDQTTLSYYYGYKEDGTTPYFNYANDFKYEDEYAEMVTSVNEYNGFYIGRYETTIDTKGNIGSVYNTPVLTANKNFRNTYTYYRWWGMYYFSKTTNYIIGNGTNVQSAMIYGQLWDKTMEFIRTQNTNGKTTYTVDTATPSWHASSNWNPTDVFNSGKANAGDVALNIYDLESNAREWTQEAKSHEYRASRGGANYYQWDESASQLGGSSPQGFYDYLSTRLALYIK